MNRDREVLPKFAHRIGFYMIVVQSTLLACFGTNLFSQERSSDRSSLGISEQRPESGVYVEHEGRFLVPYVATIPGTKVQFEMIPIPGGRFKMGSPDEEEGRSEDEGRVFHVDVAPIWVGKTEVTWDEYEAFMAYYNIFKRSVKKKKELTVNDVDAVSTPTPLYMSDHLYGQQAHGRHPATSMTQTAAKQYTKWLSLLLGQQYRLPTEAEWEYAARGGTTTSYSFGDDPRKLKEYACFADNQLEGSMPVGARKPNPFGLYDMHGNASEWTVDRYTADGYQEVPIKLPLKVSEAVKWPKEVGSRCLRGGSWMSTAEKCRSAARLESQDVDWKDLDPELPNSPWWYTSDEGVAVGFRIVRSAVELDPTSIRSFWDIDHEVIQADVQSTLEEGRGVIGNPALELPKKPN